MCCSLKNTPLHISILWDDRTRGCFRHGRRRAEVIQTPMRKQSEKYQSQANETAEGCARSLPSLPPLAKKQKRAMTIASTATSAFFDSRHLSRRFPRRSSCRSRTRGCFRHGQKRTGRKSQSIAIRARARLASPRATRVRERENEL